MTQNNAAQPVLTDDAIERIRIRAEKDSRRFGHTVDIPIRADLLLALLSKLRAEDAQASDERAAFEAYVQKRFGGLAEPWDANAARYPYGPDQARCEAWRAALAWYAEQVAGCRKIGADGDAARQALDKDGGRRARAALASAPADPEVAEVDFLVRVLENLDTWRAEEWSELLERRPAIRAMLRPMVMASAPVAGEEGHDAK